MQSYDNGSLHVPPIYQYLNLIENIKCKQKIKKRVGGMAINSIHMRHMLCCKTKGSCVFGVYRPL